MTWLKKIFYVLKWGTVCLFLLGFLLIGSIIFSLERDLPDVAVLNEVQLQVPMRIFTADGKLIAEYGKKRRIPVPFEEIPTLLTQAVLATEDQRFYEHPGVDLFGLMRAATRVVISGSKSQGGSTITMQVARNFFLSRKKTYTRKLKEILLAIKIDSELSKEKILDLYLNKIYLGNRAYGVGAAAQAYYGKPLNKLTLAQMTMIAGLPKAPSALNPLKSPRAAFKRRNHVLLRMYEQNYIDEETYKKTIAEPLTAEYHGLPTTIKAPYVAEMVRSELVDRFGDEAYTIGLNVHTTIDSKMQIAANQAMRNALINYDQRHGYRGSKANWGSPNLKKLPDWLKKLKKLPNINDLTPAIIITVNQKNVEAVLTTGEVISIAWDDLSWARKIRHNKSLAPVPKKAADVVKQGDVVYLNKNPKQHWQLAQIPEVEGALVALNPQTGAIQVLAGGFDYQKSNFNRVTQAKRQPGSGFKPFVYSAALEKGFTLASIINDAPIVLSNPGEEQFWRPQNDTRKFYGPTRLRVGLIKSRNLVSIRILDAIGINYAIKFIQRFGFDKSQLPRSLSLALGTGTVSPLQLAEGYAVFANGGYKVTPYVVEQITNAKNEIIFQAKPKIACEICLQKQNEQTQENREPTATQPIENNEQQFAPQVISPQIAYLVTTTLQDVIKQGTGRRVLQSGLRRNDIAGKTGTTNDKKDAWFAGFNSDLVTVSWVGFDRPKPLHEYGSKAALPMWVEFMKKALHGKREHSMPRPPGLVTMRIDAKSGLPAESWQTDSVFETFREQYIPQKQTVFTQQPADSEIDDIFASEDDTAMPTQESPFITHEEVDELEEDDDAHLF